jgi:hypothetical protein
MALQADHQWERPDAGRRGEQMARHIRSNFRCELEPCLSIAHEIDRFLCLNVQRNDLWPRPNDLAEPGLDRFTPADEIATGGIC